MTALNCEIHEPSEATKVEVKKWKLTLFYLHGFLRVGLNLNDGTLNAKNAGLF